jgi:hypothetical protein
MPMVMMSGWIAADTLDSNATQLRSSAPQSLAAVPA